MIFEFHASYHFQRKWPLFTFQMQYCRLQLKCERWILKNSVSSFHRKKNVEIRWTIFHCVLFYDSKIGLTPIAIEFHANFHVNYWVFIFVLKIIFNLRKHWGDIFNRSKYICDQSEHCNISLYCYLQHLKTVAFIFHTYKIEFFVWRATWLKKERWNQRNQKQRKNWSQR